MSERTESGDCAPSEDRVGEPIRERGRALRPPTATHRAIADESLSRCELPIGTAPLALHPLVERLQTITDGMPAGSSVTLPVDTLRAWLADAPGAARPDPSPLHPGTWKVWLWTVPDQTRLNRPQLLEAIDKSASWLYKQTSASPAERTLPFRKHGGDLVFVVAEIRAWLQMTEIVEVPLELSRLRLGYTD